MPKGLKVTLLGFITLPRTGTPNYRGARELLPGESTRWRLIAVASPSGYSRSVDAEDEVAVQVLDAGLAGEGHGRPELAAKDVERAGDTGGAVRGQAPQHGAADGHHSGAESETLQHRRAAGEAAIHDDGRAPCHRVRDGRQRVDGALGVVELTAAVVRHPDDVHAFLDGALGVTHGHDALEADGQLRRLLEPRHVIPGEALGIVGIGAARVRRALHGLARAVAVHDIALAPAVDLHVHGEDHRPIARSLHA